MKRVNFLSLSSLIGAFLFSLAPLSLGAQPPTTHGYAKVNGVSLYYETYGEGRPLVVIHGGPGLDHTYLLPQLLRLAGHRMLVFYDQRGTGRSTGTVDSSSMTVDNFVMDLQGLCETLHFEKIDLLGHSWGGLLAMEYACRFPRRVGRIILENSAGVTSDWETPFAQKKDARTTSRDSAAIVRIMSSEGFGKRAPPVMEQLARLLFRSYFYDQSLADSLTLTFSPETAQNMLPIYALMDKQIDKYDLRSNVGNLKCPVLIIAGDNDLIPVWCARQIQQSIPGSKLVVLKNCGHFSFIEDPEGFFAACEDFLGSR